MSNGFEKVQVGAELAYFENFVISKTAFGTNLGCIYKGIPFITHRSFFSRILFSRKWVQISTAVVPESPPAMSPLADQWRDPQFPNYFARNPGLL